MKDKVKAGLIAKGLDEALADNYANLVLITDESQLDATITSILGVAQATPIQSEIDKRVNQAVQTSVSNYEKKHNLKDGKLVEQPIVAEPVIKTEGMNPEVKAMFDKIIKQNEELTQNYQSLSGINTVKTLEQKRAELFKEHNIPEYSQSVFAVNESTKIEDLENSIKTFAEGQKTFLETQMQNSKQTNFKQNVVVTPENKAQHSAMINTIKDILPQSKI